MHHNLRNPNLDIYTTCYAVDWFPLFCACSLLFSPDSARMNGDIIQLLLLLTEARPYHCNQNNLVVESGNKKTVHVRTSSFDCYNLKLISHALTKPVN